MQVLTHSETYTAHIVGNDGSVLAKRIEFVSTTGDGDPRLWVLHGGQLIELDELVEALDAQRRVYFTTRTDQVGRENAQAFAAAIRKQLDRAAAQDQGEPDEPDEGVEDPPIEVAPDAVFEHEEGEGFARAQIPPGTYTAEKLKAALAAAGLDPERARLVDEGAQALAEIDPKEVADAHSLTPDSPSVGEGKRKQ